MSSPLPPQDLQSHSLWQANLLLLSSSHHRFGRKPILTCSYLLLAAGGSGAAYSPTLPTYMAFRFLCGLSISGISLSTTILSEPLGSGTGTLQPEVWRESWACFNQKHPVTPHSQDCVRGSQAGMEGVKQISTGTLLGPQ